MIIHINSNSILSCRENMPHWLVDSNHGSIYSILRDPTIDHIRHLDATLNNCRCVSRPNLRSLSGRDIAIQHVMSTNPRLLNPTAWEPSTGPACMYEVVSPGMLLCMHRSSLLSYIGRYRHGTRCTPSQIADGLAYELIGSIYSILHTAYPHCICTVQGKYLPTYQGTY